MKKLFFLLGISISTSSFAQPEMGESWSLQQCIEYALVNNLSIKQSELTRKLSEAEYLQSKMNLFPTLNGNISHSYNFGRTIDPFTNQFATDQVLSQNFSLSAGLLLFNGFQNQNNIKQQKYNLLASQQDLEKMKNDISLSIATAYLQILFAEELVFNATGQVATTKQQVERTKKLVDAGSLAKSLLYDIEAQMATEELNLVNAENQLTMAYLNLAQMLELENVKEFKIVRPNLDAPDASVLSMSAEQIFQLAMTGMPEIKSSEFKVKSSERGLKAAQGGLYPRLTLSGAFGTGYSGANKDYTYTPTLSWDTTTYFTSGGDFVLSPAFSTTSQTKDFSTQIDDNLNKSVGLHLTIPLFNNLNSRTTVQRSKINMMNVRLQYEQTRNTLRKNIQQAYADAFASLKKYQASQKSLSALEESFRYTEQKFTENMINSFDYADAKNRLSRTRSEMLQAKYDFFFKIKVLEYYQGKPLKF